jgi:hypothetical protein
MSQVQIPHNDRQWEVKTNRHTNTDGSSWGWIEGPGPHVCWYNNERFNRAEAGRIVKEHNDWLEKQSPLDIRIMQARLRRDGKIKEIDSAQAKIDALFRDLAKMDDEIESLENERKGNAQ